MFNYFSYKPDISDINFHKKEWELKESNRTTRVWLTEKRGAARIELIEFPIEWTFDYRSPKKIKKAMMGQLEKEKSGLLEFECKRIAGMEVVTLIGRSAFPTRPQAAYIVGLVLIPFKSFSFQINFESVEAGVTGIRESAVFLDAAHDQGESFDPRSKDSFNPYERKYDSQFPDHPLTKVRVNMANFEASVSVSARLARQRPYRYK